MAETPAKKGGAVKSESKHQIIIALDFGTTFSGMAYALSNPDKKSEVVPILDWPGKIQFVSFHRHLRSKNVDEYTRSRGS